MDFEGPSPTPWSTYHDEFAHEAMPTVSPHNLPYARMVNTLSEIQLEAPMGPVTPVLTSRKPRLSNSSIGSKVRRNSSLSRGATTRPITPASIPASRGAHAAIEAESRATVEAVSRAVKERVVRPRPAAQESPKQVTYTRAKDGGQPHLPRSSSFVMSPAAVGIDNRLGVSDADLEAKRLRLPPPLPRDPSFLLLSPTRAGRWGPTPASSGLSQPGTGMDASFAQWLVAGQAGSAGEETREPWESSFEQERAPYGQSTLHRVVLEGEPTLRARSRGGVEGSELRLRPLVSKAAPLERAPLQEEAGFPGPPELSSTAPAGLGRTRTSTLALNFITPGACEEGLFVWVCGLCVGARTRDSFPPRPMRCTPRCMCRPAAFPGASLRPRQDRDGGR